MITEKQMEVLQYLYENGKIDVVITPRIIKQNDSLYERIWKLELLNCITVKRRLGMASLHTITDYGCCIVQDKLKK